MIFDIILLIWLACGFWAWCLVHRHESICLASFIILPFVLVLGPIALAKAK